MHRISELKQVVLELLALEGLRITPIELVRTIQARLVGVTRGEVKSAVQQMVTAGDLIYTNHGSATYLELGRTRLARVSDRIVLCPSHRTTHRGKDVCIRLAGGASFGAGDHPTTRLALKGLEISMEHLRKARALEKSTALDIGTGTGVLAIASVMLGISRAVAVDTDPVACHEAEENAALNGVAEQISFIVGSLESVSSTRFDLILANLRPPTLVNLIPQMRRLTRKKGLWVLSGFRPEEFKSLDNCVPKQFRSIWKENERNWSALVVHCVERP